MGDTPWGCGYPEVKGVEVYGQRAKRGRKPVLESGGNREKKRKYFVTLFNLLQWKK